MPNPFRLFSAPIKGLLFFIISFCTTCWSAELTLAWNSDPGAVGYIFYYGTSTGDYSFQADEGTNTTVTLENLQPGWTYYFSTAAYDSQGTLSGLSTEISYTMPVDGIQLSLGAGANGMMVLSFPESAGHWYEIQSSPDLAAWTTMQQTQIAVTNDFLQLMVPQSTELPRQFFRVAVH